MVISGKHGIKTEKRKFFDEHILPSKLDLIEHEVNQVIRLREQAQIQQVKAQIREELLVKENQKKEQRRLEELRQQVFNEMLINGEIEAQSLPLVREPIPQAVKDMVWNRDGGRCVICASKEKLEFDHIIPFSKGGSNTYRNIQLLCEGCNRTKSARIG
ncbi:HNH endonuclease [Pedobacter agri]|nr:HNH endonuclease signature motif containing protein [Pedobacter agri]